MASPTTVVSSSSSFSSSSPTAVTAAAAAAAAASDFPTLRSLLRDRDGGVCRHTAVLRVLETMAAAMLQKGVEEALQGYQVVAAVCGEQQISSLDELEFRDKIGEGEFGRVWRGVWQQSDCAIKELRGDRASSRRYGKALETFISEKNRLMSLRNANIVQFYGFVQDGSRYYLVMEYMSGGCLSDWLRGLQAARTRIDVGAALRMCEDVAVGLNVLHCSMCLHCDIAARNVLKGDGGCKVADFGLSVSLSSAESSANVAVFPVRWAAPEVIRTNVASKKSDVFSFGVLLWEIFSYAAAQPYHPEIPDGVGRDEERSLIAAQTHRLAQPKGCPDVVWEDVVLPCLRPAAPARPSMSGCLHAIRRLRARTHLLPTLCPLPVDHVCHTAACALLTHAADPESGVDAAALQARLLPEAAGATAAAAAAAAAPGVLDLSGLRLDDDAVSILAPVLRRVTCRALDLSGNLISDEGCATLADAEAAPVLGSVDLTRNPRVSSAAAAVLRAAPASAAEFSLSLNDAGAEQSAWEAAASLSGVAWDPTGKPRVLTWCDGVENVTLWDFGDSSAQTTLPFVEPYPKHACWDAAGGRVAVACAAAACAPGASASTRVGGGGGCGGTCVLVYSPPYTKQPWLISGDTKYVNVLFHPTCRNLLLVCRSGRDLAIYAADTRKLLKTLSPSPPSMLQEKAVPRHLHVWSPQREGAPSLLVWGNKSKIVIMMLPVDEARGAVRDDAEEALRRWGSPLRIENPHLLTTWTSALHPSRSELLLATGGMDKQVHVWNQKGKKVKSFSVPGKRTAATMAVLWSVDGGVLFAASGNSVYGFDYATGERVLDLSGSHARTVKGLAQSPNGATLASVGEDKRLVLWGTTRSAVVSTARQLPPPPPSDDGGAAAVAVAVAEAEATDAVEAEAARQRAAEAAAEEEAAAAAVAAAAAAAATDVASSAYACGSTVYTSSPYSAQYSTTAYTDYSTAPSAEAPSRPASVSRYFAAE